MTHTTSVDADLTSAAIDLFLSLQEDAHNPNHANRINEWCRQSDAHYQAWQAVTTLHSASGKVLRYHQQFEQEQRQHRTRRKVLLGGLVTLLATPLLYQFINNKQSPVMHYHTAIGETQHIVLDDQSILILGPDSAIKVRYQSNTRRVDLLAGMAYFEVASDPQRPFSVHSGSLTTTVLGTAFEISQQNEVTRVVVDHGIVHSSAPTTGLEDGIQLRKGQWLRFDSSDNSLQLGELDTTLIASWRQKKIVANQETVAALVAQIGAWTPLHITLNAPQISAKRISGIFDMSDPKNALEAVVTPAGGKVVQLSSTEIMIVPK